MTIEVEHKQADIRTSSKILPESNRLELIDGAKSGKMKALAAANAYFFRPATNDSVFNRGGWQRGDGKVETANLFSPYWQASLADRDAADRAASWAAH